jgi:hypothetical protein
MTRCRSVLNVYSRPPCSSLILKPVTRRQYLKVLNSWLRTTQARVVPGNRFTTSNRQQRRIDPRAAKSFARAGDREGALIDIGIPGHPNGMPDPGRNKQQQTRETRTAESEFSHIPRIPFVEGTFGGNRSSLWAGWTLMALQRKVIR